MPPFCYRPPRPRWLSRTGNSPGCHELQVMSPCGGHLHGFIHALSMLLRGSSRKADASAVKQGGSSLNCQLGIFSRTNTKSCPGQSSPKQGDVLGPNRATHLALKNSLSHASGASLGRGPGGGWSPSQGCPNSPGHGRHQPAAALALLGVGLGWRSPPWCLQPESFYTSVIAHKNSNVKGFLFFSSMSILHSFPLSAALLLGTSRHRDT